jgi:Uma2 family endonuclease
MTTTTDTTIKRPSSAKLSVPAGPPPLESGDRLTRPEFERRYEAMPELTKAELIEGVVIVPSPVRFTVHAQPHGLVVGWLVVYCASTPGAQLGDNATVRLDIDNEPQPDALLRIEPEVGGRSRVGEDDYVEGPPELIVEVAASSASYDLYDKLHVYRRNGVQEYIVWQLYDRRVDWWKLDEGQYVSIDPDENGVIWSKVFPGLCLAVPALLEGNMGEVLATLQIGLKKDVHAAFVAQLAGQGAEQ